MKPLEFLAGICFAFIVIIIIVKASHLKASEKQIPIDMLIFGSDTIVVKGAKVIDQSKFRLNNGRFVHGWWDSASNTTYIEFRFNDTALTFERPTPEEVIHIGTITGDYLTDSATKSVYIDQR